MRLSMLVLLLSFTVASAQPNERPPAKPKPAPKAVAIESDREFYAEGATVAGVSMGLFFLFVGLASLLVQLVPIFIAIKRGHPNTVAITALSLLVGCTCIGWVAALVWSLTAFEKKPRRRSPPPEAAEPNGEDFNFG